MFDGYNKKGVLIGFVSTFLLEFVVFQSSGWPWLAVVLAALAPLFVGLAFFTHGAGRRRSTIGLASCSVVMVVLAALIATGSLVTSIPS